MRPVVRRTVIASAVLLALTAAALAFAGSSVGTALFRAKDGFIACEREPRVLFEPGAERWAGMVARDLPGAIELVERKQLRPFKRPLRVYVCATQESFNACMAAPPGAAARGVKVGNDVFLSPESFSSWRGDTHASVLAHELSHLHIYQRMGHIRFLWTLPVWFVEGLAVTVSGGGGEGVADAEAIRAIAEGRHFVPDDSGALLRPKRAADYGLETFMFYRQSELFVSYLWAADPEAFERLLLELQSGGRKSFREAFEECFRVGVGGMWERFEEQLGNVS